MTAAYVFLGGGLGSVLRFWVANRLDDKFPSGTLLVNVLGAFLIGIAFGYWPEQTEARTAIATGFLGGFTTFSAFTLQLQQLPSKEASAYMLASVLVGVVLAYWGIKVGTTLRH